MEGGGKGRVTRNQQRGERGIPAKFVVDGQPTDSSENGKPVARRGHKANGSQGDGRAAGEKKEEAR